MKRRANLISLPALLAAILFVPQAVGQVSRESLLLRVTVTDPGRQLPELLRLDLDLAGSDRKSRTVDVVGDSSTLALLTARGFLVEVASDLTSTPASTRALSDYLD